MGTTGLVAEIVTIGNEVLSGRTINTNAAEIAQGLNELGIGVAWVTTVGDDAVRVRQAFETARERANVVVVTGGLGPTHDDITLRIFCEMFGRKLRRDEAMLENIRRLFAERGRTLTERNISQANVPEGTDVMMNRWGTAPGVHLVEDGRHFFLLPGVPREMRGLLAAEVLPRLARAIGEQAIRRKDLHVVGLPESYLMDIIDGIDGLDQVASLPDARGEVNLRITVAAGSRAEADLEVARLEAALRERLGRHVYGVEDETLEAVVGKLLRERSVTIAVAESCTGGLIASRITDVSGSSDYFTHGFVAYANAAKIELLGVPEELIAAHGAVSREVVLAMAEGARLRARSGVALATTGIAGPGGGTAEKPVGLVWLAIAWEGGAEARSFRFGSDRLLNKARSAQVALDMIRRHLLRGPDEPLDIPGALTG